MYNSTTTPATTLTTTTTTISDANTYDTIDYIVVTINAIVFLIGVTGNLSVCLYFRLENKRMRHLQSFIFYLAISDLFASITNPFLFIYLQLTKYKAWQLGELGCALLPLTWRVFTSISFGIIMLINIDRCIALRFPFRDPPRAKHISLIMVLIIAISIAMETPYLIYHHIDETGNCRVPTVYEKGYAYPQLIVHFVRDTIYVAVFVCTYIVIKKELSIKKTSDRGLVQEQTRINENNQVIKMLLIVAAAFFVTVFPREILHITYTISWMSPGDGMHTPDIVRVNSLLTCLYCCNSICNVLIYAKVHKKFRVHVIASVTSSFIARGSRGGDGDSNIELKDIESTTITNNNLLTPSRRTKCTF